MIAWKHTEEGFIGQLRNYNVHYEFSATVPLTVSLERRKK
jgi:hypothetical protein